MTTWIMVYWLAGLVAWPAIYWWQRKDTMLSDLLFMAITWAWIWPMIPLAILYRHSTRITLIRGRKRKDRRG